jgi:hypothetical protein
MAAKTTDKGTAKRTSRRTTNVDGPTNEQIAQRAFELFLARGGEHGRHEEDWHRAERELRERTNPS